MRAAHPLPVQDPLVSALLLSQVGDEEMFPGIRRLFGGHSDRPDDPRLYLLLTVAVWPEGDQWVSQCLELDIASCGDSPDEAAAEASDAVCSYLNTLEELGERERVFGERSLRVFEMPPAEVPLASLPREVAERQGVQVRSLEIPIGRQAYA